MAALLTTRPLAALKRGRWATWRHCVQALSTRPAYDRPHYWDRRHADARQPFEWYFPPARVLSALGKHPAGSSCLEVGCGLSAVGEALVQRGYDVQCIDFSSEAIAYWHSVLSPAALQRYHVADVRRLSRFSDSTFHFAIDKGCLDALAFGDEEQDVQAQLGKALGELHRVLRPGGVLYSFSSDPPELRGDLLRAASSAGPGSVSPQPATSSQQGPRRWRLRWVELEPEFEGEEGSQAGSARQAPSYFMYTLVRGEADRSSPPS